MPRGLGVEDNPRGAPVRVQDRSRVGRWCVHVETEGSKRVRTVDENIAQGHPSFGPVQVQLSLGRGAKSVSQLRDGDAAEALRRLAHSSVGSHPASNKVARERHVGRFRVPHEVREHVTDAPPWTP